jgi:polysaccharide biosynthesis protein PslG
VCGGVGVLIAACAAPAPAVTPARVPAIPIAPSISFTPTPRLSAAPALTLHPNLTDAQNDSFALLAGRPPFTVDFSAEVAESLPRPLRYQWDRDGDGTIDSTDADPPPMTFTTPGVYTATLALTDGAGHTVRAQQRLVVIGPAKPRAFEIGVTEHLDLWHGSVDSLEEVRQACALLKDAGVPVVRWDFMWPALEPFADVPDWGVYDASLAIVREYGLESLGILDYTPPWASGHRWADRYDSWNYQAPARLSDWGTFVFRTVDRYQGDVHQWAIWNEPNLSTFFAPADPAAYTALLREAYLAAKFADPEAFIVGGDLATPDNPAQLAGRRGQPGKALSAEDFLAGMYANGAGGYFDALSFHPYTEPSLGTKALLEKVSSFRAVMRDHGDTATPLWVTELGWATSADGVSEDQQARWLTDSVTALLDSGEVSAVFWYDLRDEGDNASIREDNFGLVHYDWSPKPAYAALKNLLEAGR